MVRPMANRWSFRMAAGLLVLFGACNLRADEARAVGDLLAKLVPEVAPEEQLAALDGIATSLDPRIPAACLPMLQSPGNSVRRKAARAIGSRWWQIPPGERSRYIKALEANLGSAETDVVNMTRRAIGLVARSYDNDMFGRSPGKRWVIYERSGKPCLIDSRNGTEELLGAGVEGMFLPAYGNEPVAPCVHWHPAEEMVALEIVIFRRPTLLWVWRPEGGLRPFGADELQEFLKKETGATTEPVVSDTTFGEWAGKELAFSVECLIGEGEGRDVKTLDLRWRADSDTFVLAGEKGR